MWISRIGVLVICSVGMLLACPLAWAAGEEMGYEPNDNWAPGVTYTVQTTADGIIVRITVRQSSPGTSEHTSETPANLPVTGAPPVQQPNAPSAPQTREWTDNTGYHRITADGQRVDVTPAMISTATRDWWLTQIAAHPNQIPYVVNVDNQFTDIIWIPDQTGNVEFSVDQALPSPALPGGNANSTDPREVALDALGHLPFPNVQLKANPGLGLVAVPSWFWVEGYNGQPIGISRTVTVPPEIGPEVPLTTVPATDPRRLPTVFTVDVRVTPDSYRWSFGDGTTLTPDSLGQPYPAESEIKHTYQHSSLPYAGGFPLRLTVRFNTEFRLNGGGWVGLPSVERLYAAGYPVQEMQPVLGRN